MGSSLIFKGRRDTAAYAIYELSRQLPRGEKNEAFQVLDELKDIPTFSIVLAGCLASPLVPKMKGILDENIGIDVYGKTTSGKTAVETIAANLIYGLGDAVKQQWGKATPAGIWGHAGACNNLPIILDDSHQMKDKHLGIPHDLLNGKEGSKQIKIGSGWYGRDSTKEQYQRTILFNGEIPIVSKATADSAGIFDRIIMVNHPPFPASYLETNVEDLKQRAYDNGGFFAEPWLTHVASLSKQDVIARPRQIRESFQIEGLDKLYGG